MAKKKTDEPKVYKEHPSVDQRITDTLREKPFRVRERGTLSLFPL